MRAIVFAILAHMMGVTAIAKKARGEEPSDGPMLICAVFIIAALVCAIMGW